MKRAISIILTVMLLTSAFSFPAIASVSDSIGIGIGNDNSIDASHQIAGFSITITPLGGGSVRVVASVFGTHNQMTRIGFPSIVLHERPNSGSPWTARFVTGPHWNPNTHAGSHSHSFTFQGVAGRQHYASAQFFAQDAQGSDSRAANSPTVTAT